ncbi:adenylate kinase [Myroides injenensis]|uniref:adenylate kinase n=1 Tax=Myroides injenensis TaxID=1183151 RepID=UPI00028A03D6|nr:adenylate kinase [Myroides injenensis]
MIAIVLFGKPGAGKGTQAEFLKEKYNLTHISTGDVFRFNLKNGTELGNQAKVFIDKGELVPDEITINMLANEVANNMDKSGFLFDGFPRTIQQAEALEALLKEKNIDFVGTIGIDANDDILVARILERGKTSGRSDDQDEQKIRNRYTEYNEKTAPLINYYTEKNKYTAVDGIGSIAEVTERLAKVIDTLI